MIKNESRGKDNECKRVRQMMNAMNKTIRREKARSEWEGRCTLGKGDAGMEGTVGIRRIGKG